MKIKKISFFILSFLVFSSQAFAYGLYNKTQHGLQVKDTAGLGGINVTIPPNGSTSCNPKKHGCHGKIAFEVHAPQNGKVICSWSGSIDKKGGHYFVISEVAGTTYPDQGSCNVEYYHN